MNFTSFSGLYSTLLEQIYTAYDDILSPRGLLVKECQNVQFTLKYPRQNLFHCTARPFPEKYLAAELWWYLTGRNDVKFIANYSKFWRKIANSNGTVNSAYGHLLFKEEPNEWSWAYSSLIQDRDTRQAIMHFNKPKHLIQGIKDFPCTLIGTFQIRRNELNFTVVMRSQDMVKGLTFDLPYFSVLQQCMLALLHNQYSNLALGKLTFFVESLHIYETDFALVRQMLVSGFSNAVLPPVQYQLINSHGHFTAVEIDPLCAWIDMKLNGGLK